LGAGKTKNHKKKKKENQNKTNQSTKNINKQKIETKPTKQETQKRTLINCFRYFL